MDKPDAFDRFVDCWRGPWEIDWRGLGAFTIHFAVIYGVIRLIQWLFGILLG